MKKLLILDSNSIINRAFYGIRALSAADGTPTNAIYGFLNILTKLINEQQPDYLCAAFDLKAPTFRHKMYDGYKAQRKPMPDELAAQMPIAKDILRAMGVTIFEKEGFEPIINHSKGHSFPSRHASSSFVISMGGYFLNPYIGIVAFILSTIVCATRILTGVHYLRDVLCGALMGTIIGYIGFFVLNPF